MVESMQMLHTHYDNLKVARNAPAELIDAAYKTLSHKYHPDRNPGDSEAARIMAIINAAYEVLSDLVKRQEHDRWIAKKEEQQTANEQSKVSASAEFTDSKPAKPVAFDRFSQKLIRAI